MMKVLLGYMQQKGSLGLTVARIKYGLSSMKYPLGTGLKHRSTIATGLKTLWISANCPFRIHNLEVTLNLGRVYLKQ